MDRLAALILILSLSSCGKIAAQSGYTFEVSSGAEIGLYLVKLEGNFSTATLVNNSGYEPSIPFRISIYKRIQKVQIGFELKNQFIFVNELEPSLSSGSTEFLTNSAGVNFSSFLFSLKYAIVKSQKFELVPILGFGKFIDNSDHEERNHFSRRRSIRLALQNEFQKDSFYYFLAPQVMLNRFSERNILVHSVITFGIEMGVGFRLNDK